MLPRRASTVGSPPWGVGDPVPTLEPNPGEIAISERVTLSLDERVTLSSDCSVTHGRAHLCVQPADYIALICCSIHALEDVRYQKVDTPHEGRDSTPSRSSPVLCVSNGNPYDVKGRAKAHPRWKVRKMVRRGRHAYHTPSQFCIAHSP